MKKVDSRLKNGKAAGPDNIPTEVLKDDTDAMVEMLNPRFKKIWHEKQLPADSKEEFIKLPKTGDLWNWSNYYLSMEQCLEESLNRNADPLMRDKQAGFRKNRSCTEKIATLIII